MPHARLSFHHHLGRLHRGSVGPPCRRSAGRLRHDTLHTLHAKTSVGTFQIYNKKRLPLNFCMWTFWCPFCTPTLGFPSPVKIFIEASWPRETQTSLEVWICLCFVTVLFYGWLKGHQQENHHFVLGEGGPLVLFDTYGCVSKLGLPPSSGFPLCDFSKPCPKHSLGVDAWSHTSVASLGTPTTFDRSLKISKDTLEVVLAMWGNPPFLKRTWYSIRLELPSPGFFTVEEIVEHADRGKKWFGLLGDRSIPGRLRKGSSLLPTLSQPVRTSRKKHIVSGAQHG